NRLLSAADLEQLRRAREGREELRKRVWNLVNYPQGRLSAFQLFERPEDTAVEHCRSVFKLEMWLSQDIEASAHEKNAEEVLSSLQALFHVGASLSDEPSSILHETRLAIRRNALKRIERALGLDCLGPKDLAGLQIQLAAESRISTLESTL